MQHHFPDLRWIHHGNFWSGPLQPSDGCATYLVEVTYKPGRAPQVHVRSPKVDPGAPHRYADGSLCLYHPKDGDWHPGLFVALTIVPWTAEWLLYYECWRTDPQRRWLGPEYSHGQLGSRKRELLRHAG
jgi:hypothetical protein